jgi:hypothetical protein
MNSLNALSEDWPSYIIRADDPYRALWRELFHHAGYEAAAPLFEPLDEDLFREFRNAIKLADEFVADFEDAGETVDVVLLYYGALWLGIATAMVTLGRRAIEHTYPNHGLAANVDLWPFSLSEATVAVTDKMGALSLINAAFGGDELAGRPFKLMQLLQAIPYIAGDLEKVKADTSAFRFGFDPTILAFVLGDRKVVGTFVGGPKSLTPGFLRDHVAASTYLLSRDLAVTNSEGHRIEWTLSGRSWDEEIDQVLVSAHGAKYFLPRIHGKALAEYTICLIILFALSRLARYNPNIWIRMRDSQTNEMFVLRSFVLYAQRAIPTLVLNHLTKRNHVLITE